MIFEQFGERSGSLIAYKWDFGVPVTFMAEDDDIPFTIGDVIRFELKTGLKELPMIKKSFPVDTEDFSFDLAFNETEANLLADSGKTQFFFSIKQYSSIGQFLDTIMDGKLMLKETLKWEE